MAGSFCQNGNPEGMKENSPQFQLRDSREKLKSPERAAEKFLSSRSGLGLF
jgi:hypothetical protein